MSPIERLRTWFVIARVAPGIDPEALANAIQRGIGYPPYAHRDSEAAPARWFLATSENVGDIATMLRIAVAIGLKVIAVILYILIAEHLRRC